MKQAVFEARYEARWVAFARAVDVLKQPRKSDATERQTVGDQFAAMYREICHHLALARSRRYSIDLQNRLNQLALDGHRFLYSPKRTWLRDVGHFLMTTFPRTFRQEWPFTLAAFALFFVPFFVLIGVLQFFPDLVYSIIDPFTLMGMEQMYRPGDDGYRGSEADAYMFGYYIYNNVGIGFRMFAGGLLFCIGTLFFLLFNGVYLGAVSGHLIGVDAPTTEPFTTFIIAHGAFELTGIAIFGAAGLMIGVALLAPRDTSRWRSLQLAARRSLPLVYGATLMMVLAAFVEAYWSSTAWPSATLKYLVGSGLWLFVIAYFWRAGRQR